MAKRGLENNDYFLEKVMDFGTLFANISSYVKQMKKSTAPPQGNAHLLIFELTHVHFLRDGGFSKK